MSPRIEATRDGVKLSTPFAKKSTTEVTPPTNMTEATSLTNTPEAAESVEQSISHVSIAELYAEMEKTLTIRGENANIGVTKEIREIIDQIFEATQKDKLLLAAVVKIVETQLGRKKLYNIVRSVGNTKAGKYTLKTIDGKTHIILRNA